MTPVSSEEVAHAVKGRKGEFSDLLIVFTPFNTTLKSLLEYFEAHPPTTKPHQTSNHNTMSSPNTITMVQPATRRNVVLPNEILHKIFALVIVGSSAGSKAIDLKYYGLLSRVGMVGKLMRVNYQFAAVAVAVFY